MNNHKEDLILAFRHLESIEQDAREKKMSINYRLCKIIYGFGIGDTILLSKSFIDYELSRDVDSFYKDGIKDATSATVSYVTWNRDHLSLTIAGWSWEGTVQKLQELVK